MRKQGKYFFFEKFLEREQERVLISQKVGKNCDIFAILISSDLQMNCSLPLLKLIIFLDTDTFEKPNFEPYHPEEELDDDELSEEDIIFREKKLEKNDFVDDEAEVSYDEEENIGDGDVEDEDEDEDCEENSGTDVEDEAKNHEEDILDVGNDESEEEEDTLSLSLNDDNFKKPSNQKISQIFKHNTTSNELGKLTGSTRTIEFRYATIWFCFPLFFSHAENKVLGLESITENDTGSQITNSQIFGLCSGKFATQPDLLDTSIASDSENVLESQDVDDSQVMNVLLGASSW